LRRGFERKIAFPSLSVPQKTPFLRLFRQKRNPDLSLMDSLGRPPYLEVVMLLDILYVALALAFFAVCWLFTKACDHL
jgi:hypothetical protein